MGCTFSVPPAVLDRDSQVIFVTKDTVGLTTPKGVPEKERADKSSTLLLLARLPPEIQLCVLRHLDAESLCAVAHAATAYPALSDAVADASVWRRHSLTVCWQPWPPRPPAALHVLRVCSYRWPSPKQARAELSWLAEGLRCVHRLELVGRNLDKDTLRTCVTLWPGITELGLHDVRVQDAWMSELVKMKQMEALHLDWHTEMSCQQMLQLASDCPSLRLIDTAGCPQDCSAGRNRGSLQDALRVLRTDLDLA